MNKNRKTTEECPYFSIIVVCLNDKNNLLKTVASVLSQSYYNYEIIVKDGISNDGSLEALPKDSRLKVYSEKDSGIYDAMNQAIRHASGKYLQFLNCGDTLYSETVLETLYNYSNDDQTPRLLYGNFIRGSYGLYRQRAHLCDMNMIPGALNHQTIFFHEKVLEKYGSYNLRYRILADNDLILRLYHERVQFQYIDCIICYYLGGGFSDQKNNQKLRWKEWKRIRNTYFSKDKMVRYYVKYYLTLTPVRSWIVKSTNCPVWVKRLYGSIINRTKK